MRRLIAIPVTLAVILVIGLLPAAAQQGFNYTVRGGDTLAGIAAQFGVPLNTLATANNISNQNVVFAGQVLFIPAAPPAPEPAQPQPQFGTGGPAIEVIIAPNTPGVTPAPTVTQPTTPAVQQPTATTTYTVRTGDTLFGIATRFGVTSESIAELNDITDLNDVRVGQVLTLPTNAQFGTGGPTTPAVATRPFNYVVQPREYVELLALRFNTTVEEIAAANDLDNPSVIFPGEVLVIP